MDSTSNLTAAFQHLQSAILASPISTALLALLTTAILTRLLTNASSSPRPLRSDGTKQVPAVPYWLPLLGHIPSMALHADTFLKSLRSIYNHGIFTLNFAGGRHNIIFTPGLATALLNAKSTNASNEAVGKRLMMLNFGFPSNEQDKYDGAVDDLLAAYKHISAEPWLGTMAQQTARKIKENINSFVTCTSSPVDQMRWEKSGDVDVLSVQGEPVAEASLYPLILDFCAWTANPSLVGSDFLENNPDLMADLWTLDRGFLLLATGLPRWMPWPALTRAHIARKKNIERFEEFHRALQKQWEGGDPGPKWSSLDDVGSLVKARMDIYNKHDFSIRARASCEHALVWAANANSDPLVFWIVSHIFEDKSLLAMIREEIAPYVEVKQEETGLPIAEAPRFTKFDVDGLTTKCPLLKSCYIECLRVDTGSWSFKMIEQDFVLQSREKDAQPWLLRKGDYAHVAHDLHNTDPNYWENPAVFKADRHIKYDENKVGSVDMGSIRPYGGGHTMCKGRHFALKETLMFSAAIVAMWDIEPAGGGVWKMPRHRSGTGVFGAKDDMRVWIRRRKL